MTELLVIIPTRSRPESPERVIDAWFATGAFDDGAEVLFVIDEDDPRAPDYLDALRRAPEHIGIRFDVVPTWRPLVPKLNATAVAHAHRGVFRRPAALGFAGDDHLPRTKGWAARYISTLQAAGTGVVYCDDGYQGRTIPTQWAMTANIVRELGAMVPAPVDHLYCDNAVRDLATEAGCLHYLEDVFIEHMHPVAGKAERDEQYDRVNSRQQFRSDRAAYRHWQDDPGGLAASASRVRKLIERGRSA